ncbi:MULTISPECIES: hypothetical protein [unclassified Bartonella]
MRDSLLRDVFSSFFPVSLHTALSLCNVQGTLFGVIASWFQHGTDLK